MNTDNNNLKDNDIYFLTSNSKKIIEFKRIWNNLKIKQYVNIKFLQDLFDKYPNNNFCEIEETKNSYKDNANQKLNNFLKYFPNENIIAEDSGFEIEFLNNAPGIFSRRWLPEKTQREKNIYILEKAKYENNKACRYVCVIAIKLINSEIKNFKGICNGIIDSKISYSSSSFAYDEIFLSSDLNKSFGQCTAKEKDSVSHRKNAMQKLENYLLDIYK